MTTIRIENLSIDVIVRVTKYKHIYSEMGEQYILEGVGTEPEQAYKLRIVDGVLYEYMAKLNSEPEAQRYQFTISRHTDEDTNEIIIKINDMADWKPLRVKAS